MTVTFYSYHGPSGSLVENTHRLMRRAQGKLRFAEIGSESPEDPCVVFDTVEGSVVLPNELVGKPLWTMYDSPSLPARLVRSLKRFPHVAAPSTFVQRNLVDAGLPEPSLLPHAVDTDIWKPRGPRSGLCAIAYLSGRKNMRAADDAYRLMGSAEPFHMKLWPVDEASEATCQRTFKAEIVWRGMDEEELAAFMASHVAFVHPSRCEGFNMGALEALASGTVPIVPRFSGHLDFCTDENAYLVDTIPIPGENLWREPIVPALARAMTQALQDAGAKIDAGRRTAMRYSWPRLIDGLIAFAETGARR